MNATIVPMEPGSNIIENGFLVIEGDLITDIGAGNPVNPVNPIDLSGKIIIPGLINAHTHLAMTLYRGLADDLPLYDWLQNHIWPAEAKHTNRENVAMGAKLGLCELIRTGTTTFSDMYFFSEVTAQCAVKAGLRAVIGEAVVDFPTKSYTNTTEAFRLIERFIDQWKNNALIHPAIILHSPYACSKETLQKAMDMALKHQVCINIHISETQQEVNDSFQKHQLSPVAYLNQMGFFDASVCAAHMVWPDENDLNILSDKNVSIAHCPTSNMKLASGIAPVPAMMEKGINIALGTDGCASNNNLNLLREMHLAALLHKGNTLNPRAVTACQALEMATINGAKALKIDHLTGSLKAGKKADLAIIDTQNSFMSPVYDVYSAIVYAAESHCIESVLVNGKPLMIGRELLTLNELEFISALNKFKQNINR